MGEPILDNTRISITEYIGNRGERGELKHLSMAKLLRADGGCLGAGW